MPIFKPIEEKETTGKVKDIYEDIKSTRQITEVPNFWKNLANHPETLISAFNLAAFYDTLGRYSDAEPMYKKVLRLSQKILGEKHPYYSFSIPRYCISLYITGPLL